MTAALAFGIGVLLVAPASADMVTQVFEVPLERAWEAAFAALEGQDWGVDEFDRALGLIVTKTHRLEGGGVWIVTKQLRVRLRLSVLPVTDTHVRVSIDREWLRRERVLWVENDERVHLTTPDTTYERAVLRAIAAQLGR